MRSVLTSERLNLFRKIRKEAGAWLLLLPSLLLFAIFVWHPLISGLVLSFFETKGFDIIKFNGLQNYVDVVSDSAFKTTLANTAFYTLWSLVIGFLVPVTVAVIINEMVHLNAFFRFSVYFPAMVPGVVTAIMWNFMLDPGEQGLFNTLLAFFGLSPSVWLLNPRMTIPLIVATMTWRGFGSTAIIYLASLQGVNHELYEASTLDGAGVWARLRYVTFPHLSNILNLMLIMQIIGVFQVMYEPLTMTEGGPNNASASLMLQSYFYGFRYFQAGRSMAVGAITFMILVPLIIFYFRANGKKDAD